MVGMWYLCNTTSMREISLLFGISQTVFDCVHDFCDALCSVRNRIISQPDPQRQEEISDHFQAESKIPGKVKIIDGSHITLTIFQKEIKIILTEKDILHSSYRLLLTTCYLSQIATLDGQGVHMMPGFLETLISLMNWKTEF